MLFLHRHGAEIGRLTFEHLWLTLFALLLAVGVGARDAALGGRLRAVRLLLYRRRVRR